ncbi:SMI1/KNR4 family protein [Streptomyces sp. NPDC088762]|uniref:SMI1/KNR4 family protein n=1 Tax=Streptomyces sp. NPDC088762 TaxID=3365891 RepID=UPI0037FBC733
MQRRAPASYALLAPPAEPAEVEAAQKAMGLRFPTDLLESLACHNGITEWANLIPGQPPMSVAEILDHWKMCVEIAGDDPDLTEADEDGEPWWHPKWVPWAQSDGDSQVIDMREGPHHGRLGSAAHDDVGSFDDGWPSLAVYLTAVADALDHGGEVDGSTPYLTPEGELWWASPNQTELNGAPLTPAPRTDETAALP